MKFILNRDICFEDDNIINVGGTQLEFDGCITQFIDKINNEVNLEDSERLLFESLLSSGILIENNSNNWGPQSCQETFFGALTGNIANDILLSKNRIGIIGVPYFAGTTATIGFDGVDILRRKSLYVADVRDIGIEYLETRDYGNIPVQYTDVDSIFKLSRSVFSSDITPLFIGGDHTITYPIIQGCLDVVDGILTVLYFDSHSDLGNLNNKVAHNNVFSWISQNPRVKLISYGNFNFFGAEESKKVRDMSVHFSEQTDFISYLSEHVNNLYISFDFDCLSTSAVSYPNGYGKEISEIINVLERIKLMDNVKVLGADFVEYNSLYDTKNRFEASKANDIIARLLRLLNKRKEVEI